MNSKSFLEFTEDTSIRSLLTKKWKVSAKNSLGFPLGVVKWWPAWRRYCFFPCKDTVYDANCMLDIAAFCEKETLIQKENQAKRRAER